MLDNYSSHSCPCRYYTFTLFIVSTMYVMPLFLIIIGLGCCLYRKWDFIQSYEWISGWCYDSFTRRVWYFWGTPRNDYMVRTTTVFVASYLFSLWLFLQICLSQMSDFFPLLFRVQLGLHDKPIGVLNIANYWGNLIDWVCRTFLRVCVIWL